MGSGGIFLAFLYLCLSVFPDTYGQLSTTQKQRLLNVHNELRGSAGGANIVQSAWDVELAETAQNYAEVCYFAPNPSVTTSSGARRGENLGYTITTTLDRGEEEIVRQQWALNMADSRYTQLVWWNVSAIGCGSYRCPYLSMPAGGREYDVTYLVCYYLTVYIAGVPPFTPENGDGCSSCPRGYPSCDANNLCAMSPSLPVVEDNTIPPSTTLRKVTAVSPRQGSIGGGTRISLRGEGFSNDLYTGENEVYLQSGDTLCPCDVISYYTTTNQIVCETRQSPDGIAGTWWLVVRVRDGDGAPWEDLHSCAGCYFQYRNFNSPLLEDLAPFAGEPSSLLTISGRIFTVAFDDTPEDPPYDVITRVLVGGRLCSHLDDDGELYGAQLTSTSRGYVTCLTNTTNIIDSMNITLILDRLGSSHISLNEYIIGIDNKLRPYAYQTHAEILDVTPASGSVEGETTVTVTTSVNLQSYSPDDVQVYVGGQECEDVKLVGGGSIECFTPPQPPTLSYYPGGRGLLREVWIGGNWRLIDSFLTEPRSGLTSIQERAYRDSSSSREFGERYNFIQRYSGFFVPPVTSLYTFSILSDDLSRLYVSPSMDADEKQLIAYADSYTANLWNRHETQTSTPMMMERGQYYYMEAYSNQGTGPWNLGVSAKIHSLPYTTYPYNGDRESQRIFTTSTVLMESHALSLTASPAVYHIEIRYSEEPMEECDINVTIGNDAVPLNPDTLPSDLQTMLDDTEAIQGVGGVLVEKRVGQDEGGSLVIFRLTFLTGMGVTQSDIPNIDVVTCSEDYSIFHELIQPLTTPTFRLGFPDSMRQTRPLSVINTTTDDLQTELEMLLSSECERNIPPNVLLHEGFENTVDDGVERGVAYCGRQSYRSPTVIWNENFRTNIYTHVCFAVLNYLPPLRAQVHYYAGNGRVGMDVNFNLQTCQDWPNSFDGSWSYVCVDLRSCLNQYVDPEGQMFQVNSLTFDGGTFWVDEVAIAAGAPEVTQTAEPVTPGGVKITDITVTGGFHSPPTTLVSSPTLISSSSGMDLDSLFDPIPMLLVSSFQVNYTVEDCGSGMPLLYSSNSAVEIERVMAGSPGISGTFDLSFSGRTIRRVPAEISASVLEQLLESNFPEEGGFSVTLSSASCEGRGWDVAWDTRLADVPSMTADGANLLGSDPLVAVAILVDGGMWLRPLRGDMLRLPELSPQVEVLINKIPSSCWSKNCSFNYSTEATPFVNSVSPSSGQAGTTIILYGSGFQADGADGGGVTVWLGEVECMVTTVTDNETRCVVQPQAAGAVSVSVYVEGRGYAGVNQSATCFRYTLTVSGVEPTTGSTEGGTQVTLTGHGFLLTLLVPLSAIGAPLSGVAWLANGFAWPVLPPLSSLCRNLTEELTLFTDLELSDEEDGRTLQQLLLDLYGGNTTLQELQEPDNLQMLLARYYADLPIHVSVGSAPCVVTGANLTHLTCTTTQHEAGAVDTTVTVLGETATLEGAFSYDEMSTPTVASVDPASGPVFGGTTLTIRGTALLNTLLVTIGDAPCEILSLSAEEVQCMTPPHERSTVAVVVTTTQGIARAAMEGSGSSPLQYRFLFTYELEVNSIGPLVGSVFGGLLLTIEGRGFHSSLTSVLIGGRLATITSVSEAMIQCIAPPPTLTHTNTFINGGFSVDTGPQFSWSEPNIVVRRGDTIAWEWDLDFPGSGLVVNVFQTQFAGSSIHLDGGFASESSISGSFSYTFTEAGVFYFATELSQQLVVMGVVNVEDPVSQSSGIQVVVDDYEAEYVPRDSGSGGNGEDTESVLMPEGNGEVFRRQTEGCQEDIPSNESGGFLLFYSICSTPSVTSVTPTEATVLNGFTLAGSLLTSQLVGEEAMVRFGDHDCELLFGNDSEILCQLDESTMPPSFTSLPVTVTIPGLGSADIVTSISLRPVITSITPFNISTQGGAHIFISGHGFPEDAVTVMLGDLSCRVRSQSYSTVECVAESGSEGLVSVEMSSASSEPFECDVEFGCSVVYSVAHTPVVSEVTPSSLIGLDPISLDITGQLFADSVDDNVVMVGDNECEVMSATPTLLQCSLDALPAGNYVLTVTVCPVTPTMDSYCPGHANVAIDALTSPGEIISVSPLQGSVAGGTQLTISGRGFSTDSSVVSVSLGDQECIISSASYSQIECTTTANSAGTYNVMVTSHGVTYPVNSNQNYTFSMAMTPMITSVTPNNGQVGTIVMLEGTNFGDGTSSVDIGGVGCVVDAELSSSSSIMCTLGLNLAGEHNINVEVDGVGMAMVQEDLTFSYNLELTSFSPVSGSFAGMSLLVVDGLGFNPTELSISVCDQSCSLSTTPGSLSQVDCILPSMTGSSESLVNCGVVIESTGVSLQFNDMFTYSMDLTPVVTSINRTRGGTQGGSRILITGEGFEGDVEVTIAEVGCEVISSSATEIVCETGASGRTIRAQVMVYVVGKGFAESEDIYFWYVDLWSSRFTWGGEEPPQEGQFVVIPRGQTLVLDTVTPVLAYLLVQGGELVFDSEAEDNQVELHTQGMLITGGGKLEVGTEDKPFLAKTRIVLYGNVLSTEIPVYGAKTLALRQGSIDIHGKPLNVTWTRLAATASAGSTMLRLQEAVDWDVGGKIVLAATSFSQRENEELTITGVEEGGMVLYVDPPLSYDHISVRQNIDGREVDTSAEVGYLTRNVIVRGNLNEETVSEVSACPEEFRPGQFDLQTCFLGRFGDETLSDQFGSQIMIHAPAQNQRDVVGRFSYIEVTHAGQAFRLGRYPIHFHLNGDVNGSYVRGCSIHHTFNRAVTIHAVDRLLVEKNVAYNILGHAYFLEDGIEENNIIQDNLGVFVRASSSLLNVDITPATFWIVNPNNIVRRNAAAGGTHFGFWYRLPEHPTGPSFTESVCPQHIPLGEFSDNSAHSFGWYGLWVFPVYSPRDGGSCSNSAQQITATFKNFLAWKNDRGVEFGISSVESGALRLQNSTLMDNKLAGFEATALESEWGGPLVKDVRIVGHSEITADDDSFCTVAGIKTPHTPYLSVESVTFINFDRESCTSIAACSHCKELQGGFETRYRDIKFVNSPRLTTWQWMHEHYHRDLDGTLSETGEPMLLVPFSDVLPPSCIPHETSSYGVPGRICPEALEFARFALNNPTPGSLETQDLDITNTYGTTTVQYREKRLIVGEGHMALLPVNESYALQWETGTVFTNTSYNLLVTNMPPENYIIVEQPYPEPLDSITVGGKITNVSESVLDDPSTANTGDWFSDENNTIHYIVKGNVDEEVKVFLQTFTCFYEDCIPPPPPTLPPPIPPGRPEVTQSWSDPAIWPDGELPQAGQDVFINCSWYVLLDTPIPRLATLTICGALEVLDSMEHLVEADIIVIKGGRLVAGYPDTPFTNKVTFLLHGNTSSPETRFDIGPILGAKAMGVFGELILTGIPRTPVWTTLGATVQAGGTEITLSENVEWEVGDEIVITSTSFEGKQSETAVITAISNSQTTLTLSSPLQYQHVYETETIGSRSYTVAAEVGLLTRNIVIANGDPELADEETFGCRVLVGNIVEDGEAFVGTIQMYGVELSGCGQLGYTNTFDPRFALAVLNANGRDSYVHSSSVHDGYNTGIGVFGSSDVQLLDNIIHNTVGSAIHATGSNLVIIGNLASLSEYPPTYRTDPEDQPQNADWTANYELASTFNLTLLDNVAAGGSRAGFHINGDSCDNDGDAIQVADNIAHSTLHGVHLGYSDGHPSGCSLITGFTAHSCFHYGIFSYCPSEVRVSECTLVNNYAAIYVTVVGPPSLTHELGNKEVVIENTLIVSATPGLDCDRDMIIPEISLHPQSFRGLRSPFRGHAGIIIPTFMSGNGHRTLRGWLDVTVYPAISGMSTIRDVTFANFGQRCEGRRDTLLVTHERSEDCNHPTHLQRISLHQNSDTSMKYYNHDPILGSINPSDCVDMDCDGLKHVLVRDEDGSFLETSGARSLISMAEIEWGENESRGIGNFRIPTTMLYTDQGIEEADVLFPGKGIVRGTGEFGDESQCTWMADWNSYLCEGVDHLMIVIESLDDDTEVRRLSPIGLAANGFIDLLNGPQDTGWCGGYTCQERISTFFGIVVTGLSYTMALTSTNPQNMALHLLNADDSQAIVIAIIYNNPQRLDVYQNGQYMVPNNAETMENGNLRYLEGVPSDFIPIMEQLHGSNYYDRDRKRLHILLKGKRPYEIRTVPVIQVGLSLEVSVEDFFDEDRLVQNLAFLLGIDSSQIRVVSVIRETLSKRRRRQSDAGAGDMIQSVSVDFEIGNPPPTVTTMEQNDTMTDNETATQTPTPSSNTLSFDQLEDLTKMLVDVIQTGELTSGLNATVVNAVVMEPEQEPEDPTNGVRATPDTGGLQPGDNETAGIPTFYEVQVEMEQEAENETEPIVFTIPTQLSVEREVGVMGVEGIPLTQQPIIIMFDNLGGIIENLGLEEAWRVRALLEEGPQGAFLTNDTAELTSGRAEFSGLTFSYPGSYRLSFTVEFPESADFSILAEQEVTILPREVEIAVVRQPGDGNTTFPLYPYPSVELWEDGVKLSEHDWRNSTWFVCATLQRRGGKEALATWEEELSSGTAQFAGIQFTEPGRYTLLLSVFTYPPSSHIPAPVTSQEFTITQNPLTRVVLTFDGDYDAIIGQDGTHRDAFEAQFLEAFFNAFPSNDIEIYNITITRGSIVVSLFLTTQRAETLRDYVQMVTLSNGTLNFVFRSFELTPSAIMMDPSYPINVPEEEEDELILILVTIIPSGTVLLLTLLIILVVTLCYRHRRNTKSYKPSLIGVSNVSTIEREGRYVQHNIGALPDDREDIEEFYLMAETEQRLEASKSTTSFQSFEMNQNRGSFSSQHKAVVVSKEIKVPGGSVLVNPSLEQEEVGRYVTLETSTFTAATKKEAKEDIGGLGIEVDEILTRSCSHAANGRGQPQ